MSLSSVLVQCETLQEQLYDGWGVNTLKSEFTPILDVLVSPENKNGINMSVSPGNGKLLDVKVTYFQRLPTSVVTNGDGFGCDSDNFTGNLSHTYEMDSSDFEAYSESFTALDLERYCASNPEFVVLKVNQILDVIRRKVWAKSATQAVALVGAYSSDTPNVTSDILEVSTLTGTDTEMPAPFTLEEINLATTLTGYPDSAILMADTNLWSYMRRVARGCCQTTGIDLASMLTEYGIPTMYDREVITAFGGATENKSLIFSLGALQLLNYVEAPWRDGMPFVLQGSNYFQTTIYDASGVAYDLKVSDNCGKITIAVKATTKVVGLPDDMFPAGDVWEGMNYVNTIEVVNS
jgi:hypothetical protein